MKSISSIVLLLLTLTLSLPLSAQNKAVIAVGKVMDKSNNTPIEQATVRLLNPKDSAMVSGVVTSPKGIFQLKNIKPANYIVEVSYMGYETIYKNLQITGEKPFSFIGSFEMNEASITLDEAVITGKAAEIIFRNDTMEYNADSYKMTEGAVLEDLLKKMPGVEVDNNGKITVNGKEIKKVLVDGKEFFSDDPKVASKNLPSKMINKVQVLDRLSDLSRMSGFDDGNEETVINLTVKPGMKQGWFGNAYGGYGSEDRYEGNAMVNRFMDNDQFTIMGGANNTNNMGFSDISSGSFSGRGGKFGKRLGKGAGSGITSSGNAGANFSKEFNEKVTFGGDVRYNHSDNDAENKSHRQNILPNDSTTFYSEENYGRTKNDRVSTNLRLDWKPDSLTEIIFKPNFSYSSSHTDEEGMFNTLQENNDSINVGFSDYLSNGESYRFDAVLDFSRRLNNNGRTLSGSVSGGYNDSYNNGMNQSKTYYFMDSRRNENIDQLFRYDNKGFNYKAYLSWVEPIGNDNFIQATYSFQQNKQESLKNSYIKEPGGNDYNVLDTAYSKSYRNNFINQQVSFSFKSIRRKYDYTIGLTVDPSYSKSENFVGDTILSDLSRSVVNLAPMIRFNYRFDPKTNLKVNYHGRTTQPSMEQLLPVANLSNPLNTIIGNPDLKPSYRNALFATFQKFMPERQTAILGMVHFNYTINDIVGRSSYVGNTGKQVTTYDNVNGNFNTMFRFILNTPLKNKKFTINSMSMGSFAHTNGFINDEKNSNKNLLLMERAGIDFRSDYLDLGLNGNIRYNQSKNSLQPEKNMHTLNYGLGGRTTIYLPLDFQIESDINWATNSGFSDGFKQNEVLWNASASKSFLKGKQATIRFKMYDILKERSNISRTITANFTQDSESNTLGSYFMVHFIYKFNIFKGGASMKDVKKPYGRYPMGGSSMGGHRRAI